MKKKKKSEREIDRKRKLLRATAHRIEFLLLIGDGEGWGAGLLDKTPLSEHPSPQSRYKAQREQSYFYAELQHHPQVPLDYTELSMVSLISNPGKALQDSKPGHREVN